MSDRPDPLDRLRARIARLGAPLCLGIDPHPDALPDELPRDVSGIERFARGLVEAAAEYAAAVKVNVAFFEAFGSAGWAALERLVADLPAGPRSWCSTRSAGTSAPPPSAMRLALRPAGSGRGDPLAVPRRGRDRAVPGLSRAGSSTSSRAPPTRAPGRCRTCRSASAPLHEHVATWAASRWPDGRVGLVVGATAPAELARLRRLVPALGFLVPGVGAQDGDLAAALEHCHGTAAPGLVSISRGIAAASRGDGWRAAAAASAQSWLGRMQEAGATLPA